MKKKWETKSKLKSYPASASRRNGSKIKTEKIINLLLENRGLKTQKQINDFLNPPEPYTIKAIRVGIKKPELSKAIKRIKKAIKAKEQIIIYGDYDADGICATAILWETLHSLQANVLPFIPNREEHGYGLNKKGIDTIQKNNKVSLIITVDNGIVAQSGVAYANKKGIDVIITDHHQPPEKLPKAQAVILSTQISGAGVAWFFAKEIYQHFHKNLLGFKASNSLELACIGTVTDLMPMLGLNRSLVKYGLKELQQSHRPGVKALCSKASIVQTELDTYHIGYILGPRLNAMGRMEDALESLRLLCTKKTDKADGLALKLGSINLERQQLTEATFCHARKTWLKSQTKNRIIFISHQSYNQGVIGLVAGKLVEEFYRPAIVISEAKNYSKGSCRSIKGFNIIRFLRKLSNFFEDLGGHPMAAGFTIKTSKIKDLKAKSVKLTEKEIKTEWLKPVLQVDLEIDLADVSWKLFNQIEKFAPFGLGNPRPTFISRNVGVLEARLVGRENKHLKLKLIFPLPRPPLPPTTPGKVIFNSIAFNFGYLSPELSSGALINICYSIEKNVWNGDESLELKLKDIKF